MPALQVENAHIPSLQVQGRKKSKPDIAGDTQARTISGVFMFGSAAKEVTKNKSSLPALQELPNPQKLVKN